MGFHDYFSSGALTFNLRAHMTNGTTGTPYGGTGAPVFAGDHAYHAALFTGTTTGAAGSIVVYGHTASTGDGTAILGSVVFAADQKYIAFDLDGDTLTGLGTAYSYISAQVLVATAGTAVGDLTILSYNPRSAGTTPAACGIDALGTLYY